MEKENYGLQIEKSSCRKSLFFHFLFQILLGIVFAFLNILLCCLNTNFKIPLYMDTVFTVAASFFSLTAGLVCAALFHFFWKFIWDFQVFVFAWSICSFTLVLVIRFYVLKHRKITMVDILFLIFLLAIIISFEGAVIFAVLSAAVNYSESSQVRFMYALLESANVPAFLAALLPRIPVNILDKAISVTAGYLCYEGLCRIFPKLR